MIKVLIDEDTLLDWLMSRLEYWGARRAAMDLFEMKYKDDIEMGAFDDIELDINLIVDNDYINYYKVLDLQDLKYEGIELDNDKVEYTTIVDDVDYYLVRTY